MAEYLIATYGAFGVIGASLFGFGVSVAIERGQGWLEVKRTTPMPIAAYFVAKLAMAMIFSAIIVVLLIIVATTLGGVTVDPLTGARALRRPRGRLGDLLRPRPGPRLHRRSELRRADRQPDLSPDGVPLGPLGPDHVSAEAGADPGVLAAAVSLLAARAARRPEARAANRSSGTSGPWPRLRCCSGRWRTLGIKRDEGKTYG